MQHNSLKKIESRTSTIFYVRVFTRIVNAYGKLLFIPISVVTLFVFENLYKKNI